MRSFVEAMVDKGLTPRVCKLDWNRPQTPYPVEPGPPPQVLRPPPAPHARTARGDEPKPERTILAY